MRRFLALGTLALASLLSCAGDDDERPALTTAGLHQACTDDGCAVGQTCLRVAHPETTTSTCEIECEEDSDCPEQLFCNVPPLVPDSVPYICE